MDADLTKVVIGIVVIAAVVTLFAVAAQFVLDHWGLLLVLGAVVIGIYAYVSKAKQERNKV